MKNTMQAYKLKGKIDSSGNLVITDPLNLPPGDVEIVVWQATETLDNTTTPASEPAAETPRRRTQIKALQNWFEKTQPAPPDFDPDDPPMLENTVKMVVLAPLLDLAGFYHKPFRIETETGVALEMEDEGTIIRGRIDVLVLKNRLWLLVIESKRSDFAVTRAIPQALAYMLGNEETVLPTFGMITNGNEFLFLKVLEHKYANSRLFSLVNPDNELYRVLQVLKRLGMETIAYC
ncbi:type I restriction enzyme HsdR N-terminal domain-containing protein [Okeanomitos corallinicola TIOX110]|uniref:Type I restriction enzyme HsdR N-terminal domain-containing protein n=1 Tax=Okeanomitos corallinicola TIOX110 TaxID=3133117 RepID=A0ABZ2UZ16_9CYAN